MNSDSLQISASTEKRILHAAREEFVLTGFKGARMQKIADRAGVNKALLHYYFRSKDLLYKASLLDIMTTFWDIVEAEFNKKHEFEDLRTLIRLFVETHIKVMSANPYFPRMLLREIADGGTMLPDLLREFVSRYDKIPSTVASLYKKELSATGKQHINLPHLLLNILGMCIITFLVQPLSQPLSEFFGISLTIDEKYIQDRIDSILYIIDNGVLPKAIK